MAFFAPKTGEGSNMITDGDFKYRDSDGDLRGVARPPHKWLWDLTADDYVDLGELVDD